jgi:ribosomal protein S18 acetylase RimI-like enzyme
MSYTIERATSADADDIYRLINAAFQVENFFKYEDRLSHEQLQHYFETGMFLLAVDEAVAKERRADRSKSVGCIYIELQGDRAYLGLLAIDPAYQRSGLGTKLLNSAQDQARATGCRYVHIRVVSVRPELVAIYSRAGFTETGTEPFPVEVPTKIPCHFIKMSKPL